MREVEGDGGDGWVLTADTWLLTVAVAGSSFSIVSSSFRSPLVSYSSFSFKISFLFVNL